MGRAAARAGFQRDYRQDAAAIKSHRRLTCAGSQFHNPGVIGLAISGHGRAHAAAPRAALALALGMAALCGTTADAASPRDTVVMGKAIDDMVSLDPAELYEVTGGELVGNLYDRLVEQDPQDPTRIDAGLAVSWRVEGDGRSFIFTLRPDARFASGAPVTAEDAAFSLRRAVHLDKAPALVLQQLGLTKDNVDARVRPLDAHTLLIETARTVAPSLVYFCLSAPVASIVERRAVMAHEEEGDLGNAWLANHTAGSGPYRLMIWRPAERVTLDANVAYWRGAPTNRRVILRHVKEPAAQRLMLLRGDIDYARDLDKDQLDALAGNPEIRIDRGVQSVITYLALNQRNPYLRHPEAVEAIKYLVDYDGIRRAILGATRIVHQGFEPQGMLGALDDTPFGYDPGRAKALLAQAGLAEGFAVTMDVRNASPSTEIAEALQASFAAAGIRVELIPGDGKQVLTKYRARHHDIFLGEWAPDYPDPHSNAEAFAFNADNGDDARQKTPAWRSAWSDPAMNEQVRAAMAESDPERRAALYRALQRDHQARAPFVFMFENVALAAHRRTVDGFRIGFGPAENRYAGIAKE
jgi:peptide/nickel transport system substrate-binding protein